MLLLGSPSRAPAGYAPVQAELLKHAAKFRTVSADWLRTSRWSAGVGYHLYLRSWLDSDGDGVGDLEGLLRTLDYLQFMGIDMLLVGPIAPFAGKDGPYSVTDYTSVAPQFGSKEKLRILCEEAHKRGIRIMLDAVLSHTSAEHEWFKRALADATSVERQMYHIFGADQRALYRDMRTLFPDSYENGIAEYDNVDGFPDGKAYVFCRFHHDQPDLDVSNPIVRARLIDALHELVQLGVDAFRLDACTFFHAEPGTNGESRPAAFAFVKEIRTELEKRWGRKIPLLAETNQPVDTQALWLADGYAHTAYHFSLMTCLYAALATSDWAYVKQMLENTPPGFIWSNFLRNHDELTLEFVPDKAIRELLLNEYGGEEGQYRVNYGLKQRLGDLAEARTELILVLTRLLIFLPGKSWLFQGDELPMLGNGLLDDRESSRTPMQWTPGRFGGFTDGEQPWISMGLTTRSDNVLTQLQAGPSSLLWQVRDMIAYRNRSLVLQEGGMVVLPTRNKSVLAVLRTHETGNVLGLFSLSHRPQRAVLDLTPWGRDIRSIELGPFGTRFLQMAPQR